MYQNLAKLILWSLKGSSTCALLFVFVFKDSTFSFRNARPSPGEKTIFYTPPPIVEVSKMFYNLKKKLRIVILNDKNIKLLKIELRVD